MTTQQEDGMRERRAAARYLGYSWNHFTLAVNGKRPNRTVLAKIEDLPIKHTNIPQRLAMPGRSAA